MKKLLISLASIVLIIIIGLHFFFKPILEFGLKQAGFKDARVEAAAMTFNGTTIKNLTLDAAGNSIGDIAVFATFDDLLNKRLGKVVMSHANIHYPLASTSNGGETEKALALNLFTRTAEFHDVNVHLKTASGPVIITAEGSLQDEGALYKLRGTLRSDNNDAAKVTGQLAVTAEKATQVIKAQLDLSETSISLPDLDIKRVTGWVSADIDPAKPFPALNAQLAAGTVKAYGVPLQGTTLSASSTAEKTEILLTATAAGNTGDINAEIKLNQQGTDVDNLSVTFNAALKDLEALGVANIGGLGTIDMMMTAEKKKAAPLNDMTAWMNVKGEASITARKLSLPGLVNGAAASAKLSLAYNPAETEVSITTMDTPLTFKGRPINIDGKLLSINIPKGGIVWKQKSNALRAVFSNIDLANPDITVKQANIDITALLGDTPVMEGKISAGEVTDLQNPPYVKPFKADMQFNSLSSEQFATGFTGEISDKAGLLYVKIEGKHNTSTGKGTATATLPPTTLMEGVHSLIELFPISGAYAEEANGVIGFTANANWNANGLGTTSGELFLKGFNFTYAENTFTDINTVLKLTSLYPPVFTNQDVAIGAINIGLPLNNGALNLSLDDKNILTQNKAEFDMAKGRITASPFAMPLDTLNTAVTLNVSALDLPTLFGAASVEGLSATGTLSGILPIRIQDGVGYLENGVLTTDKPGLLTYSADKLPPFLLDSTIAKGVDLQAVLTSFEYEQLKMTLDGDLSKNQKIALQLKGKNPMFYNGRPVNFNLNVEGPLQSILKYNPGGSQIPDNIKKQLEEYEKQHAQ